MRLPSMHTTICRNASSGLTIRSALRGAKVKFKGDGLVWLADEGRRPSARFISISLKTNKYFLDGAPVDSLRNRSHKQPEAFRAGKP